MRMGGKKGWHTRVDVPWQRLERFFGVEYHAKHDRVPHLALLAIVDAGSASDALGQRPEQRQSAHQVEGCAKSRSSKHALIGAIKDARA